MLGRRELLAMLGAAALAPRAFAQSGPSPAQNLAVLQPVTVDADVLARLPVMLQEEFPATLSVCIQQRDRILLDYRREGVAKDDLVRIYSITKSVLAVQLARPRDAPHLCQRAASHPHNRRRRCCVNQSRHRRRAAGNVGCCRQRGGRIDR